MSATYGRLRSDRRSTTATKCGTDWVAATAQSLTMRGEATAWADSSRVNTPGRLDFEAREMLGQDITGERVVSVTVYPRGTDRAHPDELTVYIAPRPGVRVVLEGQVAP
jgi:hypothetical protein